MGVVRRVFGFVMLASVGLGSGCGARRDAPGAPRARAVPEEAATTLTLEEAAADRALLPVARGVLAAFANDGALLLGDGRYVLRSSRDGVPALYVGEVKTPDGPLRKLASPQERVLKFVPTSDERHVLFLSDTSGDGLFRVHRVAVDGGPFEVVAGAPGTAHRALVSAAEEPSTFAYVTSTTDELGTRVVVQTLGGTTRELLREPFDGFTPDLSDDGTAVSYVRRTAQNENTLFELLTSGGPPRPLYPTSGAKARITTAVYAGDDVLIATEEEGRPARLLRLHRRTGAIRAAYEETLVPFGVVDDVAVAPHGRRVALVVDAGNHAELRLLDGRTLSLVRTVDLGLADVSLGSFARDGRRLTVTVSRPDRPVDVAVVDTETATVTPLRADVRPTLATIPSMRVGVENVRAHDGLTIPVNVYRPDGSGRRPTVVRIHGGPSGSAYVRWDPEIVFLVARGFAVVEPNIRGSTGFGVAYEQADDRERRGDALRDVATVRNWAAAQAWCDGERMAIMGRSYGGYMTLLALTRMPGLFRAGIDAAGMSDLRTMERLEDQRLRAYDETEFGVLGKDDALLAAWSPLTYADRIVSPVLIEQGVRDPVTPRNEADQIVRVLRRRGVPHEYVLFPDEGHSVVKRENAAELLVRVDRFLRRHLGLASSP